MPKYFKKIFSVVLAAVLLITATAPSGVIAASRIRKVQITKLKKDKVYYVKARAFKTVGYHITPVPDVTETPVPGTTDEPVPGVTETPAQGETGEPVPGVTEAPACTTNTPVTDVAIVSISCG